MWDDGGIWMEPKETAEKKSAAEEVSPIQARDIKAEAAGEIKAATEKTDRIPVSVEAVEDLKAETEQMTTEKAVEMQVSEAPMSRNAEAETERMATEKAVEIQAGAETTGKNLKNQFSFFGPATMLYAAFYALCMYRNGSGITFPFFLAGSLLYFFFSMKKLGLTLKRDSGFYMGIMMLLAISTFCTDDARIIAFNKTGIFLLMISLLLNQFYHTQEWGLGKYLISILVLLLSSVGKLPRPVSDGAAYFKTHQKKEGRKVYYVLLGLLITVPIFLIVLSLLSSADAVFRQVTEKVLSGINFENLFGVAFRVGFWYFAVYMLLSNLCGRPVREEVKDHRTGEPLLAITVTAMLSALYLFFSGIQIIYLFVGNMELPGGYTYAEYAREGFFQLLAVSIINLIIVLFCMTCFRESRPLKWILTIMSLCTFVMIASSALRMVIYIRYYYLTFLRILVLWSLAVLTLLFVGVLVQIYREKFPLFRYGVTVVSLFYLFLSFSHPDYWIARVNVANSPQSMAQVLEFAGGMEKRNVSDRDFFQSTEPYQDYRYLAGLSADAAPVLIPYMEKLGYEFRVFDYTEEESERNFGKNDSGNAGFEPWGYWDAVEYYAGNAAEYYSGQRKADRRRPEGFGYYYLKAVQENTKDMGVRGFNVSRYYAVKLIREAR